MQEHDIATLSDDEHERMLSWIDAHWNVLAAFAWRSYMGAGRGIVVLQGDWSGDVFVAYQPLDMSGTWTDELIQSVRCYKPQTEMIFLIQHGDGAILLGIRTPYQRQAPHQFGQEDGPTRLVPAA